MAREEVKFDGKVYYVGKPGANDEAKAKLQQSRVFNDALEGGACLRDQLNKILKVRKIWSDEDDKEIEDIANQITSNLEKLDEGGIEILEARKLAIETNSLRMKMLNKISILNSHKSLTAEGQADDAYFDSLVSSCCFNEDGTKVFRSYDDYISKSNEDLSVELARKLSELIYGNLNYIKDLPENKFLSEYGFINSDMQYVNEAGELVNADYKKVEDEAKKVDKKPFLKDGQPIAK